MKTVVICVKDDGAVKVGELPEGETYANTADAEYEYMQEVGSAGEALEVAEGVLSGETPEAEARADAEVEQGFDEAMPRGPAPARAPSRGLY